MKKTLSLCLAVIMVFLLSATAFAEETFPSTPNEIARYVERITPSRAEKLSVEQLQNAAHVATTDAQANIILDALLDKVESGQMAAKMLTETYVSISSVTQTNNSINIYYRIISKVPSGAYLELGVKYPLATRMPAESTNLSTMSIGTYKKVCSSAGVVAKQVYAKFAARDFSRTDVYTTLYFSTSPVYDYHTLTAVEAFGHYVVTDIVPFATTLIFPQSKIIKVAGVIAEVAGITYTIAGALDITKGLPAPVAGQYYETKTWYSNNKLYTHIKVWANKSLYDKHETPMYDSGSFVAVTLPDF